MNNKSTLIGFFISCFFLFLAFRGIDFSLVQKSLKEINMIYILFSFLSLFGSYTARSFLWKTLIGISSHVNIVHSFKSVLIGNMGNSILPARLGDLLRVHSINKYTSISKSLALGTMVVERVFDLIILIQLILISVFIMPIPSFIIEGLEKILFVGIVAIIVFIIGHFVLDSTQKEKIILFFFNLPFLQKINAQKSWEMFKNGIYSVQTIRRLIILIVLSAIAWMGILLYVYFMLLAFSFDVSFNVSIIIVTVLNLGYLFVPTPGNIGVYQILCITALSYFGIDKNSALSYSFVLHATDYIPTVLLGMIFSIGLNIKISEIKRLPTTKGYL